MKEKPILFNTEMVQAILDGRKTQTRRVVKTQPDGVTKYGEPWVKKFINRIDKKGDLIYTDHTEDGKQIVNPIQAKYQKGDILWVRETWKWFDALIESDQDGVYSGYQYKASTHESEEYKWKPSIHMPKDAARIWLKVTNVRCERLQDISEGDAIAEGLFPIDDERVKKWQDYLNVIKKGYFHDPRLSFWTLWKSIYGSDSWMENPWVWVYEFEVLSTTGKP